MGKFAKVSIVLLGYAAALGLGFLAGWWNDLRSAAFAQNSGGMVAEGDSIAFFLATGVAAILPTALALFFLRSVAWFWDLYSRTLFAIALTGPPLLVLGAVLHDLQVMQSSWALLSVPVVARIFSLPILAPADLASAWLAPDPQNRRRLLAAMSVEMATGLYVAFNLLFRHRFM